MGRFSEVFGALKLRNLPLHGGIFTWSGGLNNETRSRLDRFLISDDWEGRFSDCAQCLLQRPTWDHNSILLDGGGMRSRPTPLRFENMWLKEDFIPTLKSWWEGIAVHCKFYFDENVEGLKTCAKRLESNGFWEC